MKVQGVEGVGRSWLLKRAWIVHRLERKENMCITKGKNIEISMMLMKIKKIIMEEYSSLSLSIFPILLNFYLLYKFNRITYLFSLYCYESVNATLSFTGLDMGIH